MSTSNTKAIADIYTARAKAYDASSNWHHVREAQSYLWHLKPHLQPGGWLLDLACGTGLIALPAKSLVGAQGRVVGVDLSPGMLDVARHKSREQCAEVEWYEHDVSDLASLRLDSARGFDVITCAAALVLLPSPAAAVQNWTRLLKPGGRLMTDVLMPGSNVVMDILSSIGPDVGEPLKWDMTRFPTQASLCKVLEDACLEVEQIWESEVYGSTQIDVQDGADMFEKAVQSPMFANFGTEQAKDRARSEFVWRLKALGGAEGKLTQDTKSWMCIARKPR